MVRNKTKSQNQEIDHRKHEYGNRYGILPFVIRKNFFVVVFHQSDVQRFLY